MEEKDKARISKNIEMYGCHVIHVLEDEEHPRFTYSIGIERRSARPEVIVMGINRDGGSWMVNEYNRRVMAGEVFEVDTPYAGFIEGFDVIFKEVEKRHYNEYFGYGVRFYQSHDFRALQMIYPSTAGVWPWDEDAPEDFLWFIPPLYK